MRHTKAARPLCGGLARTMRFPNVPFNLTGVSIRYSGRSHPDQFNPDRFGADYALVRPRPRPAPRVRTTQEDGSGHASEIPQPRDPAQIFNSQVRKRGSIVGRLRRRQIIPGRRSPRFRAGTAAATTGERWCKVPLSGSGCDRS
jgi:hypothetical protein